MRRPVHVGGTDRVLRRNAGSCSVCSGASTFWANPCGDWIYDRCTVCGHVDLRQPPSQEELQRYYDSIYQQSAESLARAVQRRYVAAVERAAARIGLTRGRVLEVGCNTGQLLVALRARGWEVAGVELGVQFRSVAMRHGLDIRQRLEDWATDHFTLIVSFHVLEHVPDANAALRAMRQLLDPGGVLVVKTPNVFCLSARLFPGEWEWSSPPAHLRLYSPVSLQRALILAGFEEITINSIPGNARPFPFLAARALAIQVRGRDRRYTPGLDPNHTPVSGRVWYRTAESAGRVISLLGAPVQPLLNRLMLAPELAAVARVL